MKAQIQAEVFIYILAVVITGSILLFGYVAIKDFIQKGEEASFIKLKTDITHDISVIRGDYGSVTINNYQIPSKYSQVCFVGEDAIRAGDTSVVNIQNPIIQDSIKSKVQKNVFFVPDGTDSIYVGPLEVPQNFLCFKVVQGTISIRLEGKGDKTSVSNVPKS